MVSYEIVFKSDFHLTLLREGTFIFFYKILIVTLETPVWRFQAFPTISLS